MSSTELGASALTGAVTRGFTVAGAGLSPSSAAPFSQSGQPYSTLDNTDGCDIAASTMLQPRQPQIYSGVATNDANDLGTTQLPTTGSSALSGAAGTVYQYKMSGMDHNTFGVYDAWKVTGAPDYAGAQYTGLLALPLRDIVIAAAWVL